MKLSDVFQFPLRPKPGTVIRLVTGRVLLVGDVNQQGGICNDCRDDDNNVEVDSITEPVPTEEKCK